MDPWAQSKRLLTRSENLLGVEEIMRSHTSYQQTSSDVNDLRTFGNLPPLIKGYLRVGGKVSHDCFVDYEFNTIDLCVIVKIENIEVKYKKKFLN